MKTEELLMKDYENASDLGGLIKNDPEKLELVMKEKDNVRNEMIKMESVKMELKCKREEIEAENKRTIIKVITETSLGIITILGSWYWAKKTFQFDEQGTITSTLGRGILANVMPKGRK